jgi:hypothetical protein
MMNLRSRARLAKEARPDPGHLRDFSVYDFKSDHGIQNHVASPISGRDCSRAELNRKTVRPDFHFKVVVFQRSRRQSPARVTFSCFLAAAQKTQVSETTKAFAFGADLREGSSADRTSSDSWFGFHTGKFERSI